MPLSLPSYCSLALLYVPTQREGALSYNVLCSISLSRDENISSFLAPPVQTGAPSASLVISAYENEALLL